MRYNLKTDIIYSVWSVSSRRMAARIMETPFFPAEPQTSASLSRLESSQEISLASMM